MFVHLLFIHLSIHFFVYKFIYRSIHCLLHPFVHSPIHSLIRSSISLFIYLLNYPSIPLFIRESTDPLFYFKTVSLLIYFIQYSHAVVGAWQPCTAKQSKLNLTTLILTICHVFVDHIQQQ